MKKKIQHKAGPLPAFLIAYPDSDFTNPHEALLFDEPKDCRDHFTHMGKKYWGFETRRHCATKVLADEQAFSYDHNAHNWLDIGLRQRARVTGINISTKWYTGNQVRAASVVLIDRVTGRKKKVLERVRLQPDSEHIFDIPPTLATECRVECYSEGGIGRITLIGEPVRRGQLKERPNLLEEATISHVSNEHYGRPDQAVRGSRREMHMVGWESARTGFGEKALFHLRSPAVIEEFVVDTYLHRLNSPLSCHVFGINAAGRDIDELLKTAPRWGIIFDDGAKQVIPDNLQEYMLEERYLKEKGVKNRKQFKIRLCVPDGSPWKAILPFATLQRDTWHSFKASKKAGTVTHVLYMHYPNGGIHGLKAFGTEKPVPLKKRHEMKKLEKPKKAKKKVKAA